MLRFSKFYQLIADTSLGHWLETLPAQLAIWQKTAINTQTKAWFNAIDHLPKLIPAHIDLLHSVSAFSQQPLAEYEKRTIEMRLKMLMPWRKGPYNLYDIHIDTEWRSDLKWLRLLPHISSLIGRQVLDVGCGSGYHLWRMVGAGARLAVGIDPTTLFYCQFQAIQKLLGAPPQAHFLPLGIEQLPELAAFDTVFSMGVLYHRRSPLDHLYQLKAQLVSGGELVLETLVIEGDEHQVLVPSSRYAKMSNIYFIPSASALSNWLAKCGFIDIRICDLSFTTSEEQRRTAWMQTESLTDFLDHDDPHKTIEGYPAPLRAIIIAKKP